MADAVIISVCNKQGRVEPWRLLSVIEAYLKQETVAIHRLNGRAKLSEAVEMMTTIMSINELFEVYSMELRGLIGLRARPWNQEESVKDMKMIKGMNKCA